jgi:hypothetical protein
MAEGWLKLHRALAQHELWLAEPFTRGQAWVDLLMLANYRPGSIRVQGVKIELERGDVGWSEVALAERWRWSRGKVRRFMGEMKSDGMVAEKRDTGRDTRKHVITIINYDKFQISDDGRGTGDGTGNRTGDGTGNRTGDGTGDGTRSKNEKNEKKVKKEESPSIPHGGKREGAAPRFTPPSVEDVAAYCEERSNGIDPQTFCDHYAMKGWLVGKTVMKDWKAAVRTWEGRRREEQGITSQEEGLPMDLDSIMARERAKAERRAKAS